MKVSTPCAGRVFAELWTMHETSGTTPSCVGKCLRCVLQWPPGSHTMHEMQRCFYPVHVYIKKTTCDHRRREKKKMRNDGSKKGSFLSHGQLVKCLEVGVCRSCKYVEEYVCYLFSSPLSVQDLPSWCFVSSLSLRICWEKKEKQEIWSKWWHYKAHHWFHQILDQTSSLLLSEILLLHLWASSLLSSSTSRLQPSFFYCLILEGKFSQRWKRFDCKNVCVFQMSSFVFCFLRHEHTRPHCALPFARRHLGSEQPECQSRWQVFEENQRDPGRWCWPVHPRCWWDRWKQQEHRRAGWAGTGGGSRSPCSWTAVGRHEAPLPQERPSNLQRWNSSWVRSHRVLFCCWYLKALISSL